eukprot:TRINITY_DN7725_c0_g2_i1.p2 TRINITY_DN7725_c0_g2~~TRINITY_DN7725_c0_g2_i1.p2  ORF type:complete len:176 (+),score=9.13 TRINITY_DN7725_c0_g2_i1:29-529(+)
MISKEVYEKENVSLQEAHAFPEDYEVSIENFQRKVSKTVLEQHITPDRLVNMDETPLYFALSIPRVVAEKGAKAVSVDWPKNKNNRVTLVLAVASDGNKLPPLLIFKGKFGKTLQKKVQKVTLVAQKKYMFAVILKHGTVKLLWNFWYLTSGIPIQENAKKPLDIR